MALIGALTKEQVVRLDDQGYLALPEFISPAEVAEIGAIFDHLLTSKAGWQDGNQFDLAGTDDGGDAKLPQILYPSRYAPALKNHAVVQRARQIAEAYFGEPPHDAYGEHMIFKPPRDGAVTPWHQDQAYHDPTLDERALNFWIPLDDCDGQNGCMHYVPGSNRLDVLPHHSIGHDPSVHGLEVDEPEKHAQRSVSCPLPAGGCVIHLPTTLHYAGPNRSGRQRRAYILIMEVQGTKRDVPVDNYWMREKRTARMERAEQVSGAEPKPL